MTDHLIRKLANEYAEEMIRRIRQTVCTPPEILLDVASSEAKFNMEDVIRFLLRRYCIVEKSKIKELEITYRAKHYNMVVLNQDDVKSLFPEIAKEVEG